MHTLLVASDQFYKQNRALVKYDVAFIAGRRAFSCGQLRVLDLRHTNFANGPTICGIILMIIKMMILLLRLLLLLLLLSLPLIIIMIKVVIIIKEEE